MHGEGRCLHQERQQAIGHVQDLEMLVNIIYIVELKEIFGLTEFRRSQR
jgi:hypothetical protein